MPPRKSGPPPTGQGKVPVVSESEQASLGAALRDPGAAELVLTELAQTDFYSAKHQKVFLAIQALQDDSLMVNPVSVAERSGVTRTEVEDLIGAADGTDTTRLKTLVSEVRRVSKLRSIWTACQNTMAQLGPASKVDDVVGLLEKAVFHSNDGAGEEAKDAADTMRKVVADFLDRSAKGGGPELSTGLTELDRAIVGLRPGKMGVIAARPSMGKTALAGTIRRAVLAQGQGVLEFALEMSAEELMERELAYQAGMNLRKVLTAKEVSADELARAGSVAGAMLAGRWWVDDRTYGIAGIRRKARILHGRMARQGIRTGLVIIDYLQLAGDSGESREQSIAAVSRGAKFLAKELECTVLALSQLNRSCEYREDRRPMMSDLRESGSIEQDADWVGFVYREHMYDNSFPAEETEFIIRKQRSGPTGTVRLHYNPKQVSFGDVPQMVLPATEEAS